MKIGLVLRDTIRIHGKLIIDGHHRYIASIMAGYTLDQVQWSSTSAKEPIGWEAVALMEEDIESEQEIRAMNEIDAQYNSLTIEELTERLK